VSILLCRLQSGVRIEAAEVQGVEVPAVPALCYNTEGRWTEFLHVSWAVEAHEHSQACHLSDVLKCAAALQIHSRRHYFTRRNRRTVLDDFVDSLRRRGREVAGDKTHVVEQYFCGRQPPPSDRTVESGGANPFSWAGPITPGTVRWQ